MDRPGRRTFVLASVFLVLVGVLHTLGQVFGKDTDPALIAINHTLERVHVPLGLGMAPSLFAIQHSLSLTMSITLLWLGLLGAVVGLSDASRQVLRRMTFVYLAGGAALTLLYLHDRIPPPCVSIGLVEAMYALALIRQAMV